MDSRISSMTALANNSNEPEFNAILFEKRLMQLKDSQESINSLSAWCLENRIHHKKIVNAWLSVLKKVKIEQRLTLFYLANDVIQYSKRKNYDFVESWSTTLQKATTLVREEKVKARILRIFKIWEQRGVYGEEFIADLSGLISASPAGHKLNSDPQDFQPAYLVSRIRSTAKLETDTDLKLKILKDSNPKITDSETLCASLKDRQHVEDVEHEVEGGITLIEGYVNALRAEIKSRSHLISCLSQADVYYNTERKEVKVVVNAYKNFTTRVKNLQKKLEDLIPSLGSPIPSPDVNAPSPEPDSDIDLPNSDDGKLKTAVAAGVNVYSLTDNYNANYYTPTTNQSSDNFANNGFSSFMGSNMPFDLQNFSSRGIFSDQHPPDPYMPAMSSHLETQHTSLNNNLNSYDLEQSTTVSNFNNSNVQSHSASLYQQQSSSATYSQSSQPLLPPPMPPFTSSYMDTNSYTDSTYAAPTDSYVSNAAYESIPSTNYAVSSEIQTPYQHPAEAYNPEEEIESWDPSETVWDAPPDLETPESPPIFEKESFTDPVEYDDSKVNLTGIGKDVDHRVLLPPPQMPAELASADTDLRVSRMGASKDVDHRNLISLTGSPRSDTPSDLLQPPPAPPSLWSTHGDQDYRTQDQDYRVQSVPVDIAEQLKLPPPPPPPKLSSAYKKIPGNHDNVESIDMDLSDDENSQTNNDLKRNHHRAFENNTTLVNDSLEPPPIPPNLTEDLSTDTESGAQNMEFDEDQLDALDLINNIHSDVIGAPIIQTLDAMNPAWSSDEWFENRPPNHFHQNFNVTQLRNFRGVRGGNRGISKFNSQDDGFRNRGRGRGAPRGRPFRGVNIRGNFNNRGHRSPFRGKFRGGF